MSDFYESHNTVRAQNPTRNTEHHPNTERFIAPFLSHYGGYFGGHFVRFLIGRERKNRN